ncbi:transcription factor TFIIIB, SANT domain, putative [Perkinsus marinus ATCC 50983]|uniref:Transcription factor TFIIIB, SANT domain, putative n=1 Tax=Perkinsus marinus (strain ATCC 50983 / TXsc) TaxID=423536 RepID=C5LI67_PERM5|nr:transcription factor TFIIIB, SANT domain, putative [Perkinsus marinus ATCC 50983]EER03602.1 transcription factor TFIIIB, SANT domain, putative [Perkinsus marinus ATCC 50983]|eukprot:XP_002771786.1 transcription factor TFIIIB, SANT domain, putative [Perkinsus marinus ATCC 50983]
MTIGMGGEVSDGPVAHTVMVDDIATPNQQVDDSPTTSCVVVPRANDAGIDPIADVFSNAHVPSICGDPSPLSTNTDVVPSHGMTEIVLLPPSPSTPGESGSEVGNKRRRGGRKKKKADKPLTSTQISRRIAKRVRTELGVENPPSKRSAKGHGSGPSQSGDGTIVDLINRVVAQDTAEEKEKKGKNDGESPKTPATQADDLTPLDGALGDLFGMVSFDKVMSTSSPSPTAGDGVVQQQLKFDESGNIVLQQDDSGSTGDIFGELNMMTTTDESGRCEYKDAYKRTHRSAWSDKETDKFYEALSMYGPDLMMISTVFGSTRTSSQLNTKMKNESKRNPVRFAAACNSKKAITTEAFVKDHGPIEPPEDPAALISDSREPYDADLGFSGAPLPPMADDNPLLELLG